MAGAVIGTENQCYMQKPSTLRENDAKFLEIVFQEIRKIHQEALFNVVQYVHSVRVEIQSKEEFRGKIFNKLYHLHKLFGLHFKPTQFIKRDKNIISFDYP